VLLQLGAATIGCGYNWGGYNWEWLQLGAVKTGCGYNCVWLQMGVVTTGCGYIWARLQLGAATTGCFYNWVRLQLGASIGLLLLGQMFYLSIAFLPIDGSNGHFSFYMKLFLQLVTADGPTKKV
jgi:hypothetical protein